MEVATRHVLPYWVREHPNRGGHKTGFTVLSEWTSKMRWPHDRFYSIEWSNIQMEVATRHGLLYRVSEHPNGGGHKTGFDCIEWGNIQIEVATRQVLLYWVREHPNRSGHKTGFNVLSEQTSKWRWPQGMFNCIEWGNIQIEVAIRQVLLYRLSEHPNGGGHMTCFTVLSERTSK